MSAPVREPSLIRACIAASGWALLGLGVGIAASAAVVALLSSLWGLLVGLLIGAGVALTASYANAARRPGQSTDDRLLAVVWALASYVWWLIVAGVVCAVIVDLILGDAFNNFG
jgi:hypothetical protein